MSANSTHEPATAPVATARRTVVVEGPLALKMRRVVLARAGARQVEVLTLPLLAARLAGGFVRHASADDLHSAIGAALAAGGFADIERQRALPGMVRAVARTLGSVWRADFRLNGQPPAAKRLADLARIESHVRRALPAGAMIPPDLRDAALARLSHAPAAVGEVELDGLLEVHPVWRSLVEELRAWGPVVWRAPGHADHAWFRGDFRPIETRPSPAPTADLCADPQAEAVEALRWARALLASGDAEAAQIAIAAAETHPWDEHFLVLARSAGLPLHFMHGMRALDSWEGQACAALAELLARGLSQDRVRRLVGQGRARLGLPEDWARGLPPGAALTTVSQWREALVSARGRRETGEVAEAALLPILAELEAGMTFAAAGERLLAGVGLRLWREALRAAPPEAMGLTLASLRLPDASSPAACVCWGPASYLATCPRPYVRLLGLTSRGWPRARAEDPLAPAHLVPPEALGGRSRTDRDLMHFAVIAKGASGGLALSRSHRAADGALQGPSRLWPAGARTLSRSRIPSHAFSETDRLMARPTEARAQPLLAQSRRAWRAWQAPAFTDHDGQIAQDEGVVAAALARVLPTAALRRLLRDPLAFVWSEALGWSAPDRQPVGFELDPGSFGELVHELIGRSIGGLEPNPGAARANAAEQEAAVSAARAAIAADWPLRRPLPPPLLWRRTLDRACALALAALADQPRAGARAWAELAFGEAHKPQPADAPWDTRRPIELGPVRLRGRADRLDLSADVRAPLVTDYKTGKRPSGNPALLVLGEGAELQRIVYGLAARQLLAEAGEVSSRLVYLGDGAPVEYAIAGEALERAGAELGRHAGAAARMIGEGRAPPGPDARDPYNPFRLALPADLDGYSRRKGASVQAAAQPLAQLWGRR